MSKHTSDDENNNNNNREVQSPPPPSCSIDNAEVETAALQTAVRNSIRTTPGAFAVTPLDIARNTNTATAAATTAADVALRSAPSSAAPQQGAGNSLGAAAEVALSSSSDGAFSITTNNNSGDGGMRTATNNYNGHYLPANIDIIAEATLVPSQHEMEEELNPPTEAACELVPISDNNSTPPDEESLVVDEAPPSSEMVTSLNHDDVLADSSRQQQHNANCSADNTLPTAVIATAEPMGRMHAVICNRHFRLGWWHFLIVIAIVLLIVLPSALIPQRRNKQLQEDDTTNWMDDHTDNLQATIEQILIQNSISNPATFNDTSSPQYKHWIGCPTVAMEQTQSNQNQSKGPLRTLYNDTSWQYCTTPPRE
eukprot:scaffold12198_cov85-Skeletonema_dohrnii-CCMP3373.AAC.3